MSHLSLTKLIEKKRKGGVLREDEISYFLKAVIKTIRDDKDPCQEAADRCQIGAMLMAFYLKGLNDDETVHLTQNMTTFGHVFSWPQKWRHLVVDKHSTGGVGDKVSLVLTPAVAALGLKVPMISGRKLGHTGGTLDKLDSIPGFRSNLSVEEIMQQMESVGCCIVGQTAECVPADKILYQCRELTATVTSAPLIIASIVSKKLAEGVNALVYDVKFGKGSIFNSESEALETAKRLVSASSGVKASALFTSMDCPLGNAIGNALEVQEAIQCLRGNGPKDVLQIVEALGSELLSLTKNVTREDASFQIRDVFKDGGALRKFHDMIRHQGVTEENATELCYGDPSIVLLKAKCVTEIKYTGDKGYVSGIDPLALAKAAKDELFLSLNHPGVGFTIHKHVCDEIQKGDVWLKFYHESNVMPNDIHEALSVSKLKGKRQLIHKRIFNTEGHVHVENYS